MLLKDGASWREPVSRPCMLAKGSAVTRPVPHQSQLQSHIETSCPVVKLPDPPSPITGTAELSTGEKSSSLHRALLFLGIVKKDLVLPVSFRTSGSSRYLCSTSINEY